MISPYHVRKVGFIKLALLVGSCGLSLWLSSAMADDVVNVETVAKIPPLAFIPDSLYTGERAKFSQQRLSLQNQLAAYKTASAAYTAKTADEQTDAEFNKIDGMRKDYIVAAKAFNAALAAEMAAEAVRATLPAAKVVAHGEFYIVTKDGCKLTGAEAATIPLDGGTRVVTGSDGRLQMLLPDETVFTIGRNGDMVLDDFVYDHNHSLTKAAAQIMKGTFRWVTGKLSQGHEHDVKVKLPVGCIGDRGTDYECLVESDGAGYVKLYEGKLEITENKTGKKIELYTKQMISFTADGTFSQPTPLSP